MEDAYRRVQNAIGYTFRDPSLLRRALTHRSAAFESPDHTVHYERLEFLGDSVLQLAVSRYLYDAYPDTEEGELSRTRAALVREESLAEAARAICLGEIVLLGHGEEHSGGRDRDSILCDLFEALIGAVYLDADDYPTAQKVTLRLMAERFARPTEAVVDYKTMLQERVAQRTHIPLVYELIAAEGPDHARRFTVRVCLDGKPLGQGEGGRKRRAEQEAARAALRAMDNKDGGETE